MAFSDPWSALIVTFTVALLPVFMILLGLEAKDRMDVFVGPATSPGQLLRRRGARHGNAEGAQPLAGGYRIVG